MALIAATKSNSLGCSELLSDREIQSESQKEREGRGREREGEREGKRSSRKREMETSQRISP